MRTKNAKAITAAERAHMARRGWYERRFESRPTAKETQCRHCGRAMWLPPSKVEAYVTCGGECAAKYKARGAILRARACETCGGKFTPRSTQISAGQGRYCSQKCNRAFVESGQSPEAREKQRVARLLSVDTWAHKVRGENSPRWSGGRPATYERRKAAGVFRDQNNRRRDYRRKSLPKGAIPRLEKLQRMKCANCCTCLKSGYHLDHIVPISKGGAHEVGNVQLLCPACNRRKSALMPSEWAQLNGRLV